MIRAAVLLPIPCCARPRRQGWIAAGVPRRATLLLIDHANCEKKAASTALALMFAYAEDLELDRQDVAARARRAAPLRAGCETHRCTCGIAPQRLAPGRYAERLRRLVAQSEPQREVDLMICGAFIEARSCERFAALAPAIGAPLRDLFHGLHDAEARHYQGLS